MKDTETMPRSLRIKTELWEAALATASRRGETLTDVVRRALAAYVRRHREESPE